MFYIIFLIFAIQIWDCSACSCPGSIMLPTEVVYIIGITIPSMFCAIVALSVIVYRHKRRKQSGDNFDFGIRDKKVKYERQHSGNSERSSVRRSCNEDTAHLTSNDDCAILHNKAKQQENSNSDTNNVVNVENESKPKVNIKKTLIHPDAAPYLDEEQMKKICQGVINKVRITESTSLSDLDKILSDVEEHSTRDSDISASTPALDVYNVLPSPVQVKQSIFGDNHFKAQEEMKAKFKGHLKSINNGHKIIPRVTDEVKLDECKSEIKSEALNTQDDIKSNVNESELKENVQEKNNESDNINAISKDIHAYITEINDLDSVDPESTNAVQDGIYECPPPPRCRNIIVTDDEDAAGYHYPLSDSLEFISEPYYGNAKCVTNLDSTLSSSSPHSTIIADQPKNDNSSL